MSNVKTYMVGSLLLLTTVMGISRMVDLASSPLFFCLRFPSGAITGAPDSPLWHSLDEEVGEPWELLDGILKSEDSSGEEFWVGTVFLNVATFYATMAWFAESGVYNRNLVAKLSSHLSSLLGQHKTQYVSCIVLNHTKPSLNHAMPRQTIPKNLRYNFDNGMKFTIQTSPLVWKYIFCYL